MTEQRAPTPQELAEAQQTYAPKDPIVQHWVEAFENETITDLCDRPLTDTYHPPGSRCEEAPRKNGDARDRIKVIEPSGKEVIHTQGDDFTDKLPEHLAEEFESMMAPLADYYAEADRWAKSKATLRAELMSMDTAAKEVFPPEKALALKEDWGFANRVGAVFVAKMLEMRLIDAKHTQAMASLTNLIMLFLTNVQMWFGCGAPLEIPRGPHSDPELAKQGHIEFRVVMGSIPRTQDGQEVATHVMNPALWHMLPELWLGLVPEENVPSFHQRLQRLQAGPSAAKQLAQQAMAARRMHRQSAPAQSGEKRSGGGIILGS